MARPSVLVTRRWPAAVEAQLMENYDAVLNTGDKSLSPSDIRETLGTYDAVLPTVTDKLTAEALDVPSSRTKILANYGVGYSHICEDSARGLGLTVTNTPDVLSECTADLAMTLLLMAARRAGEGGRELRAGNWTGWRPTHLVGTKASGKTLGIIGCGRIGREMARRAHFGFGMKIVVQNRSPLDPAILAMQRDPGGHGRRSAAALRFRVPALPRRRCKPASHQHAAAGTDETGCLPDQHRAWRGDRRIRVDRGTDAEVDRRRWAGRVRRRAAHQSGPDAMRQSGDVTASRQRHARGA